MIFNPRRLPARDGGRYTLGGVVTPKANVTVDANVSILSFQSMAAALPATSLVSTVIELEELVRTGATESAIALSPAP
ncbi:MAG: hypothetical protein GY798_18140 [Hyphomicrobiales bacterium]|nr:hypothetical protein [Hyphomicrobiales bacterium]